MPEIPFSFDDQTYAALAVVAKSRGKEIGELVREGLSIAIVLNSQREAGFTKVLVENPATEELREISLEGL